MHVQLTGLVVKETNVGENDKSVAILTADKGIVRAWARGARNIRNRNSCAAQIFSYSRFVLYRGAGGYIIDESEVLETFLKLRDEISDLSLAQYFCEIVLNLVPENEEASEFLRLTLNSLYYLESGKKKANLIKAVFEIRACASSGYMPDLVGCKSCGTYESSKIYFSAREGTFICDKCFKTSEVGDEISLRKGTLNAMRHVAYSPLEKAFAFSVSDDIMKELSLISEKYILERTDGRFKALEFYKEVAD